VPPKFAPATFDRPKNINDGTQTTNGTALNHLAGKIDLHQVGIRGPSRGRPWPQ